MIFCLVGTYCLMNLLTAIIYNQFRGYLLVSLHDLLGEGIQASDPQRRSNILNVTVHLFYLMLTLASFLLKLGPTEKG